MITKIHTANRSLSTGIITISIDYKYETYPFDSGIVILQQEGNDVVYSVTGNHFDSSIMAEQQIFEDVMDNITKNAKRL